MPVSIFWPNQQKGGFRVHVLNCYVVQRNAHQQHQQQQEQQQQQQQQQQHRSNMVSIN